MYEDRARNLAMFRLDLVVFQTKYIGAPSTVLPL